MIYNLFDDAPFRCRAHTGWSDGLIWSYVTANLLIAFAYITITVGLLVFSRMKKYPPLTLLYSLFASFIFCCGVSHMTDAFMSWWPAYRLSIVMSWLTAVASWATIFCIVKRLPMLAKIMSSEQVTAQHEETQRLNKVITMRVETLEAFNRNVCHDLNAPLRTMQGFADALMEDHAGSVPPKAADYLFRIQTAAHRMQNLLKDLMRLSNMTYEDKLIKPVIIDITTMVKTLVREEKTYPKHERVEVEIQEGMKGCGDPELVNLLFHHVISNAFKFTSRHFVPKIKIGKFAGEFFVSDNGVGFNQAQVGLLFKPFTRLYTGDDIPGTGIGLTICKRVTDIHGGYIRAEGVLGEGAKFSFTLSSEGKCNEPNQSTPSR